MINWFAPWNISWLGFGSGHLKVPENTVHTLPRSTTLSARKALDMIARFVEEFDKSAILRSISAPQGVDEEGKAAAWDFSFDAPTRRAQAIFEWRVLQSPDRHAWHDTQLTCKLMPFPPVASPVHRIVSSGFSSDRLLEGAWKSMRDVAVDMPLDFSDSSEAVAWLKKRGLSWEGMLALHTEVQNERVQWVARAHGIEFQFPVEKSFFAND